jgi:hypothetical protein
MKRSSASIALILSQSLSAQSLTLSYSATVAEFHEEGTMLDMQINFFDSLEQESRPLLEEAILIYDVAVKDGKIHMEWSPEGHQHKALFQVSTSVYVEATDLISGLTYPRQKLHAVPFALGVPVDNDRIYFDHEGKLTSRTFEEIGKISRLTAGEGLLGGGVIGEVALAVDVGNGPGKIVQLDDSGKLPVVDGSRLTGLAGDISAVIAGEGLHGGSAFGDALVSVNFGFGAKEVARGSHEHADATYEKAGFMSSAEKLKLASITAGADKTDFTTVQKAGALMNADFGDGLMAKNSDGFHTIGDRSLDWSRTANQVGLATSKATADTLVARDSSGGVSVRKLGVKESVIFRDNALPYTLKAPEVSQEISLTLPTKIEAGKLLTTDGEGQLSWTDVPEEVGKISKISAGTGLIGGGVAGNVTLSVDTGLNPHQIVQLDRSGKLPAVDGSKLTGLTGDISSVSSGPGLIGGSVNGDAELAADFGKGPDQVARGSHEHGLATQSASGFMDFSDKKKLDAVSEGADQTNAQNIENAGGIIDHSFIQSGSPLITVTAKGQAGIGTSLPKEILHVRQEGGQNKPTIFLEDSSPEILLGTTSSNHTNWRVAVQETVNGGFEIASGATDSDASDDKQEDWRNRFVIDGNQGFVGIGTDSPQAGLDVAHASGIRASQICDEEGNHCRDLSVAATRPSMVFAARIDMTRDGCALASPIPWVAATARLEKGLCQLQVAADTFSDVPICTCTAQVEDYNLRVCMIYKEPTTSSITVLIRNKDGRRDAPFQILCTNA